MPQLYTYSVYVYISVAVSNHLMIQYKAVLITCNRNGSGNIDEKRLSSLYKETPFCEAIFLINVKAIICPLQLVTIFASDNWNYGSKL
jgi:hypothetical protein